MSEDLFGEQPLRALSWKEPYAALMLHGKIETRPWVTSYRGKVLLCASKLPFTTEELMAIAGKEQWKRIWDTVGMSGRAYNGNAFAIGELIDCRKMKPSDEDDCFAKYNADLYCHIYQNVMGIEPVPFKGRQGWTKLDDHFMDAMRYLDFDPKPI